MRIKVVRKYPKESYIIGNMYVDGVYFCNTLERPWQGNKPQVSCIPTGRYLVELTYSSKFERVLPLLMDVPKRSGIRIHAMNYASQSLGCIGVGLNTKKGMITQSRKYEDELVSWMRKAKSTNEGIVIEIEDA